MAVAVSVAGCTLVDQNTFNANAGRAPVIPAAPKPPAPVVGPAPLLRIPPTAKPAEYVEVLRKNVAAARARKATVVFDVVEMQPPGVDADGPIGTEAAAVGRMIVDQGVPPVRVRLAARPDADATPREVRVYVR